MATRFTEIRKFVRGVVGDSDDRKHIYSDEVINTHIRLSIMEINEIGISENSGLTFTSELSNVDKVRVIYTTAKSLISPLPNEFSYKTPVTSVRRKGMTAQIMNRINEALDAIQGGSFASVTDEFWETVFQGPDKLSDEISKAL